ncbi:MAG TPA: hypothetical protein VK081_14040, partial [Planctomycetota bacterium]|nr:hypothetical protein [Planctomycetota bacterium]
MRVDLHNAEGKRRRRARLFLVGAPIASALAAGGLTFWACDGRIAVGEWMRRHGHHAVELRTPWLAALADLPGSWFRAAPAPQIDLGISFRNLQLLRAAREAALRAGYLSSASKQSVPATVTVGGATTRCKVRLKGDHLDHILGRKVSMRVQATDGPAMLGMRAFSLQTPPSKGFQLEALFHESVRHCGLLAPRYEFARVACNGDDFGLMAVEEHVAPELFAAQGRRDGPVVRLQEEPMFEAQARLRSSDPDEVVLDDYRTAAVETIGSTAHPEQEPAALALLRAFVAGTLAPAQVFAVDELAGYLAICELWGAWHALRWHNLRFHFDPATGRLAPIGFDANLNMRRPVGQLVTPEEPIVLRMLSDPEVFAAFRRRLAALCAEVQGGTLLQRIAEVDARCRAILRGEYWFLQAFPLDELRARAAWLATLQDGSFRARAADAGLVPLLVSEVADGDFRVRNRTPWEVVVHGARWVDAAGHAVPAELPADWRPFRMIPPRPDEGPIPEVALRLPRPNAALQLVVEARIAMVSERHWARAMPQPLPAHAPALPETSAGELVARHPWLTVEDDGRTLRVARGRHRVERTVVVPRGRRLVAGAGTELVFAA